MPHTPEPWGLHYHSLDEIYILHSVDAETGRSIRLAVVRDEGELSPGELESNAELLVRAPKLLHAFDELFRGFLFLLGHAAFTSGSSADAEMRELVSKTSELLAELKKAGVM